MMSPYEVIKCARALLSGEEPATRSAATEAEYARIAQRLIADGGGDLRRIMSKAGDTTSPRTWFKRRAALIAVGGLKMACLLAEQDKVQRMLRSDPNNTQLQTSWSEMVAALDFHQQLLAELPRGCPIPQVDRRKRNSKKQVLRHLPVDWREKLLRRMPKYRTELLLAAVTGIRPGELLRPVTAAIVENELVVLIEGKKVKAQQGQPWRELSWCLPIGGMVGDLVEMVRAAGGELSVQLGSQRDVKNFSSAVRDAARREWPSLKKNVTPYCLRHQFSADLKAGGVSRSDIAAALGQASDETCQYYGSASQSKSAVIPSRIEAARPVRQKYQKNIPIKKHGKFLL